MINLTEEQLEKLPCHFQIAFALFCAKQVIHLVEAEDKEACNNCIEVVEAYLEGKATREDCEKVANAAYSDAHFTHAASATYYTAYAAANITHIFIANTVAAASAAATFATNKEQTLKEQHQYYQELLNFDNIANNLLLGEL